MKEKMLLEPQRITAALIAETKNGDFARGARFSSRPTKPSVLRLSG